jgi:hypothetical protein
MSDNGEFANFKKNKNSLNNSTFQELQKLSIFLSRIFKKSLNYQLKKSYSVKFLNWLYNENPNGKAIINNVYKDEKIIAHFALVPITVVMSKKTYRSALTVFTSVDENHRGLHFLQLAWKSFEHAKLAGIRFIIGVANETSSELYVKCFKFKLISPLIVKVGLSKFEEKNNSPHKFEILRDKKTLKWRLSNPRFKYQIYRENDKYIIFNNNYKLFKMNMGYISNKDLDLQDNSIFKDTYNLNPFNMWIGLNNNLKNTKMSFNFPKILKPSSLNLIIKDLNSEETNLCKEDIKFNLIDYEMF